GVGGPGGEKGGGGGGGGGGSVWRGVRAWGGGASTARGGASGGCSARNGGSLPAEDQPPNVGVTITCKPTSAALVTHGTALCSGESKPGGSCWTSSMIRKISGPLHHARDSSSSADSPGGGSRRANTAPNSAIIA